MAFSSEILMVVAIGLLVVYVSLMLLKHQKPNLPPGPTPLPIIGSFHLILGKHPHKIFAVLAQTYGPLMSMQIGQKLCVVVTSPEAAKEFLKLQDANFAFRPSFRAAELIVPKDIIFHSMTPVLRHLKKILVTELISTKRVEESKHIRAEEIAYMLRAISKETGPFQVNKHLNIMSTNILSRMILNKRFNPGAAGDETESELHKFFEILEEANHCFSTIHLQDGFTCFPKWFDPQGLDKRFRNLRDRVDLFHKNMVDEHRERRRKNPVSEGDRTLLDVLLDQIENSDFEVTEEHVKGVIWDAFVAGVETTKLIAEWAMAEVLRNPTLVKQARSELNQVVGMTRIVQESDISELKYIQAIVKETLRLHSPSILIPHHNITATQVSGYDIPANTTIFVNVWAIARDPAVWEQPRQFLPERFLENSQCQSRQFQGQCFEFIPFGAGRRSCPGMAFGLISMHLEVANLLHAFEWSFPDGMDPQKLDMSDGQGLVIGIQRPLVAVTQPRLPFHVYY